MINYRCKNCCWWDAMHARLNVIQGLAGIGRPGLCRKHKPGAERVESGFYLGVQPIMDAEDFCGEFRDDTGG